MKKQCSKCKVVLDLDMFGNHAQGKYGKRSMCKACKRLQDDEYRRTIDGVITRIYMVQKQSSKKRNHPSPKYSKHELKDWLCKEHNFIKQYDRWVDSGYDRMEAVSVDRLDNSIGYELDNIQVISWRENIDNYDKINSPVFSKEVAQLSTSDELIHVYPSAREASRVTGVSFSTISTLCNGKGRSKTAGGFKWKFNE